MNIEKQYLELLKSVLETGTKKTDRTGVGTISKFGGQIRHKMSEGFPLLTTKFVSWKTVFKELQWFLKGSTSLRDLLKENVHIWTGDAYAKYKKEVERLEEPDYLMLNEIQDFVYLTTKNLYKIILETQNKIWANYYDFEKFELDLDTKSIDILNFVKMSEEEKEEYSKKFNLDKNDKDFPKYRSKNVKDILRPFTIKEFEEQILTNDKFNERFGDLGPIYGSQWRKVSKYNKYQRIVQNVWTYVKDESIDQIKNLLKDLKENPDSRRLKVSAWNVADLPKMILSPCHDGFQCYTTELTMEEKVQWVMQNTDVELENLAITEEVFKDSTPKRKLSLMWNQRSQDLFLGASYNIASYAFLLCLIAKEVNMIPDELICNLGDYHIYLNHIEAVKEQLEREPKKLPTIKIKDKNVNDISEYSIDDIEILNYEYHPTIKAKLNN